MMTATQAPMTPVRTPMAPVCYQCQTVFQDPKVLPCLHTFCSKCLQNLASIEANSREVTCPTCGCFITLPPSGVQGLKTNVFVKRLSDLYFEEIKTLRAAHNVELDEGFADQAESIRSSIPRSETWHGPNIVRELPSMIQSKSVNGDVPLSSFTSLASQESSQSDVSHDHPGHNEEEDLAKAQTKREACSVVGKLTTKLMNLQGEALRLTYAIDTVNESVNHWKDRNTEIKTQIQDRSQVLQHLIKEHEQKLLAEVDNMDNHEQFLNEADRAKNELRANLKRVLNAVQFLKQIQNFAHDDEILELKEFLLGDLKILTSVETEQKDYTFSLPSPTETDSLAADFGHLVSVQKRSVVFEPESVASTEGSGGMKMTQLEKVKQMEFTKATNSKLRRSRRAKTQQIRFSSPQGRIPSLDRRSTRIITSEERYGLSSPEKSPDKDTVDMSHLQETLKQRRRDFIEEKKFEDNLVNVHDVQLLSVHRRPTREKKRRVQSFGGRASSRTRQMEQAAREYRATNTEHKNNASLDKADSVDSANGEEEGKPQVKDDISTKLKYLRENWRRRREILRSSETSNDPGSGEVSPKSPNSPNSPTAKPLESKFNALRDQYTSIRTHFAPNETKTTQETSFQRPVTQSEQTQIQTSPVPTHGILHSGSTETSSQYHKTVTFPQSQRYKANELTSIQGSPNHANRASELHPSLTVSAQSYGTTSRSTVPNTSQSQTETLLQRHGHYSTQVQSHGIQNAVAAAMPESQSFVNRPTIFIRRASGSGIETQAAPNPPKEDDQVFFQSSTEQTANAGGLTRTKLMQIRDKARKKKEMWRSQTLS